jgi:hypothetical protein
MSLPFSTTYSRRGLVWVWLVGACAEWGCQVDERNLSAVTPQATTGGAAAEAASGSTAAATASGSSGQCGCGVVPSGAGANSLAAGAGGGAGVAGRAGGASGTTREAGGAQSGGTDGTAGNPVSGAAGFQGAGTGGALGDCGDIDQDMIDDCAETIVQNSRFDSDVSYWDSEPLESQAWDARNARAGTGSGSLLISNVAPVASESGSFMVGAHQCLQVTAGGDYEAAARVLIPSGQGAGEAGINVQIFGADDCAGSFLEAETVATTIAVDTWSVVQGEVILPASARSLWVRLVASKPFAQPTLDALFDDVLVRQK